MYVYVCHDHRAGKNKFKYMHNVNAWICGLCRCMHDAYRHVHDTILRYTSAVCMYIETMYIYTITHNTEHMYIETMYIYTITHNT